MILINNEWYNPKDLDDVSKIIREQFNYDLADKMDELMIQGESDYNIDYLLSDISSLEMDIDSKDFEINELQGDVEKLQDEIEELNREIESLNDHIERLEEMED